MRNFEPKTPMVGPGPCGIMTIPHARVEEMDQESQKVKVPLSYRLQTWASDKIASLFGGGY